MAFQVLFFSCRPALLVSASVVVVLRLTGGMPGLAGATTSRAFRQLQRCAMSMAVLAVNGISCERQ